MIIIFSSVFLVIFFVIYKKTYILNNISKSFQYILLISFWGLGLYNCVIGNMLLEVADFSFDVGINFLLGILLFFSGIKVMNLK